MPERSDRRHNDEAILEELKNLTGAVVENAKQIALVVQEVGFMRTDLFGNGQPGLIEKILARLGKLEGWRSWTAGAVAAIGGLAAVVHLAGALK